MPRKLILIPCALMLVALLQPAFTYTGGGIGGVDDEYVTSLVITPANATLFAGNVQQFTAFATVLVENGTETKDVTHKVKWRATIGEIDENGVFRARKAGVGVVKAIYGTMCDEARVVVEHGPVHTIEITVENKTVISRGGVRKNSRVFFGLKAYDREGNPFLVPEACWECDDPEIGQVSEGIFTFNQSNPLLFDVETGEFNRSYLNGSIPPPENVTVTRDVMITAWVASDKKASVVLTLHAGSGVGDDYVTTNATEDPEESASVDVVPKIMAIQVIAANNWDFGTVYPGTPTGWSPVTFKNIGTCDVIVTIKPPAADSIFKYLEFKDAAGDIYDVSAFSILLETQPIYDEMGRIIGFSSEEVTVDVRLNLPPSYNYPESVKEPITYVLSAV